jgi:hypothetical protein
MVGKLLKVFGKRKPGFFAKFFAQKGLWKRRRVILKFSTPLKRRKITKNAKKLRYNDVFERFSGFPQFPQVLLL